MKPTYNSNGGPATNIRIEFYINRDVIVAACLYWIYNENGKPTKGELVKHLRWCLESHGDCLVEDANELTLWPKPYANDWRDGPDPEVDAEAMARKFFPDFFVGV